MTEKHISKMTKAEYICALRAASRDLAPPPPAPRKPTIASAMTDDEYRAAKRAITAKQTKQQENSK